MNFPPLARATLALAAAPWCISAQTSFTMVVFNYSAAPRSVIELAAATARRAFLAARIQSRWIVCEESCSQGLPPGPAMQAFVMPRLRATLPGSTTHHTAGYAVPSGFPHSHAYAFWDAASEAAERTERPIYVVLGVFSPMRPGTCWAWPTNRTASCERISKASIWTKPQGAARSLGRKQSGFARWSSSWPACLRPRWSCRRKCRCSRDGP